VVTVSYGGSQSLRRQDITGPTVHVGGRCGLNAPFADAQFTPAAGGTVGTTIDVTGLPSSDADHAVLQLISGSPATSDGCGLSQPLTFAWSFATVPEGSAVALIPADAAETAFTPDIAGTYSIQLTVGDGTDSGTAQDGKATTTVDYEVVAP